MTDHRAPTAPTPADPQERAAVVVLAKLASPGEWKLEPSSAALTAYAVRTVYLEDEGRRVTAWPLTASCGGQPNEANARFAVAAQPSTILAWDALITQQAEEIERLKAVLHGDRLAEALEEADATFGFSTNLIRLVDGVYTYRLKIGDQVWEQEADDMEWAYEIVRQEKAKVRAAAILALTTTKETDHV